MSEELKELPVPQYLSAEEKRWSRKLYEENFIEDTEKFTDFYYTYKIRDNEILGLKEDGQLVAMLHLNPYYLIVNGYEVRSSYIVAVATRERYRHRGYMRILLEKALRDSAARKMPFVFLMPASESIYAPFDFVWRCPYTAVPGRVERMEAEEQNHYLAARYQMFCRRDQRYLENLRAEREAEKGEIPPDHMPPYMLRITDVSQALRLVGSRENSRRYLHITDPVIAENNGYFLWETMEGETRAERLDERPGRLDLELSVGELVSLLFSNLGICLSEVV